MTESRSMAVSRAQEASVPTITTSSLPWVISLRQGMGKIGRERVLRRELTTSERQDLQAEIRRLRASLTPCADRESIATELGLLLVTFPTVETVPAKLRVASYIDALADMPLWAIREARQRIVRGEADLDGRFAPTPPQVASIARRLTEPVRDELRTLEEITTAKDPGYEPGPEERARIAEGFAKLRTDILKRTQAA